jgi:hypothetical protein
LGSCTEILGQPAILRPTLNTLNILNTPNKSNIGTSEQVNTLNKPNIETSEHVNANEQCIKTLQPDDFCVAAVAGVFGEGVAGVDDQF